MFIIYLLTFIICNLWKIKQKGKVQLPVTMLINFLLVPDVNQVMKGGEQLMFLHFILIVKGRA